MLVKDYIPCEQLRPYIKTYKVIESREGMLSNVLPATSLAVAFRIKGKTNYLSDNTSLDLPNSVITGLRKSARLIHYEQDTATIVIIFRETGAASFFRVPIHELFCESLSLDQIIEPQQIVDIEEQLAESQTYDQRIAVIEHFLLSRFYYTKTDLLVSAAVDIIYQSRGTIRIKELAARLCISSDAFEKRFRKIVGTSPKQFSYIIRMRSVVRQKAADQNISDIAFEAGYFDQAHFNKDFKLFTGKTPGLFFKSAPLW